MRTRTNRDPRPGRPRPGTHRNPASPPSTAWLEAQAAFSAPAATPAATPAAGPVPVVVVRRSRPLDAPPEGAQPAGPGTDGGTARPARVFRVVSAPAADAGGVTPAPGIPEGRPPRPRRARRSQQAPGVATVISFAVAATPALTYREQMARLGELMRALDEALALALRARSFELTLP